jgi:hypothetical protein
MSAYRVIAHEHTARRDYKCATCDGSIPKGSKYVRNALPPWTEANESDRWWVLLTHGKVPDDCPDWWVVDDKLMQNQHADPGSHYDLQSRVDAA